jgi:NAD(P)H dehydrogenase (quinone)
LKGTIMREEPPAIRHLIVSAYPIEAGFGAAIVDAYRTVVDGAGQSATVRNLYSIGFDPVLRAEERPGDRARSPSPDVAAELDLLDRAAALVLVYPIWYGLPPAMLIGYVDRVLGANYSYRQFRDRAGQPQLAGKPLLSVSTSGLPLAWLEAEGQAMAIRQILDVYLWRGFGMQRSEHVMLDGIEPGLSAADAERHLARVRGAATRICAALAGRPVAAAFEA